MESKTGARKRVEKLREKIHSLVLWGLALEFDSQQAMSCQKLLWKWKRGFSHLLSTEILNLKKSIPFKNQSTQANDSKFHWISLQKLEKKNAKIVIKSNLFGARFWDNFREKKKLDACSQYFDLSRIGFVVGHELCWKLIKLLLEFQNYLKQAMAFKKSIKSRQV